MKTAKPPLSYAAFNVHHELLQLSKGALVDLYAQALATQLGHADTPVRLDEMQHDAIPMLRMRGDRIPRSWRKK